VPINHFHDSVLVLQAPIAEIITINGIDLHMHYGASSLDRVSEPAKYRHLRTFNINLYEADVFSTKKLITSEKREITFGDKSQSGRATIPWGSKLRGRARRSIRKTNLMNYDPMAQIVQEGVIQTNPIVDWSGLESDDP
jgi:hypothetical protein